MQPAICTATECAGHVAAGLTACLAHLDEVTRDAYLGEVRNGRELDGRGVRMSAALFEQATRHLRVGPDRASGQGATLIQRMRLQRDPAGLTTPGPVRFDGALFEAPVSLDAFVFPAFASFARARFAEGLSAAAEFQADASFQDAVFRRSADFTDALVHGATNFDGAEFKQLATFTGARFDSVVSFKKSRFRAGADFANTVDRDGAIYRDAVDFSGARFSGPMDCQRRLGTTEGDFRFDTTGPVVFAGPATFRGCVFDGPALFDRASFETVNFQGASFTGSASFAGAQFGGRATFDRINCASLGMSGAAFAEVASFASAHVAGLFELAGAACAGDLVVNEAVLGGRVDVTLLQVAGRAWFIRCQFASARDFGPLVALDKLDLDHASFAENVRIEVATPRLLCRKTNFRNGVYVLARWAVISLEEASFGGPAVLVGAPSEFDQLDETALHDDARLDAQPSLASVRRANVANLTVANVDLRPTRFAQAQNLDKMRLGDPVLLAETPQRFWWSPRSTIAEEQLWRAGRYRGRRGRGWYPAACRIPQWVNDEIVSEAGEPVPTPQELASIYRQLRKNREDGKDEPGAADFYYGEMEMRRKAAIPPNARSSKRMALYAERAILWIYWAVSGYGLRASRALAALLLTLVFFADAISVWGFPRHRSYFDALLYSAQCVTSLLRAPTAQLSPVGEWLSIALRLSGPLLFGLVLVSLRGRVRR